MRDEVLHLIKQSIPPVGSFSINELPISRYFTEKEDMRPVVPHYQSGGIEPIDFINSHNFNFNLGNCIKYVTRAGKKGDATVDLRKAIDYLNFEIERIRDERTI